MSRRLEVFNSLEGGIFSRLCFRPPRDELSFSVNLYKDDYRISLYVLATGFMTNVT